MFILPGFLLAFSFFQTRFFINVSRNFSILLALIAGPPLAGLILFYQYLLISGMGPVFHMLLFLALTGFLIYGLRRVKRVGKSPESAILPNIKSNKFGFLSLLCLLSLFVLIWSINVFMVPIIGHDILEYGSYAKQIFLNREIQYTSFPFFPSNGFYFVGKHGYGMVMFHLMDLIFSDLSGTLCDGILKAIGGYYGVCLILICTKIISELSVRFAILSAITLALTFPVLASFSNPHLDTFRMSLLVVSLYLLFKNKSEFYFMGNFSYALFAGLFAFSHSIGFLTFIIVMLVSLLFSIISKKFSFLSMTLIFLFFMFFGGLHYLLDSLWGTQWLIGK